MKLLVRVIEAKNIPAMDTNGFSDPYVKLQLGKQKFRSKVVKKCLNPSWCEEFIFKVDDLKDELYICVLDEDRYCDDFVGQIKVPVFRVFEAQDKSLGTAWYTLQPKTKKANNKECGEILLTICFSQNNTLLDMPFVGCPSPVMSYSPRRIDEVVSSKDEKVNSPTFKGRIANIFNKNVEITTSTRSVELNDASEPETVHAVDPNHRPEDQISTVDFEESMRTIEMRDQGGEIPSNLSGGVVIDQLYAITPRELNSILFSQDSAFLKSFMDTQGSKDLQTDPWKFENNGETLKRVVSYTRASSRLVKALKAIEEQTYVKANDKAFAVLAIASTPDAPYGKTFKVEVLYCITEGPNGSTRLIVSFRVNFSQSTMMKGMIEGGVRQGLKETFDLYKKLLSEIVKPLDVKEMGSEKDQFLASIRVENQSDWRLAIQYFVNFKVVSTVFMGLYVFLHVMMAMPSTIQGLEFDGLDLPDSIGEVIVCGLIVLQGKHVLELIFRFLQARMQKGSDHGLKANGDGWLLTVALIEGSNLAAVGSTSDPYVVFTCNGKTRTSSIKFQKSEPVWNEIFEFDATDEPPSILYVEVFDFDGPYNEAISLGRAEINFLKHNISDLSDIWIDLQGKVAQASQSKLRLRIFLNNTRGNDAVRDYIAKMEKEVGKKIKLRSPQTNSAFQKLFGLPSEEFLINDFSCNLKRKMPLQGRLFLSARIIGFHADLFGHKTKFFLLWEDIEEIEVINPTLSSMGSPIIIITLRPGRGSDARHGARTQDSEGRLKFHFHSFVSFNVAHRTIMALWRLRASTHQSKVQIVEEEEEESESNIQITEQDSVPEIQAADDELEPRSDQIVEEESEAKSLQTEDSGVFLGIEPVQMSMVYSSILSIPTSFFMELFRGSEIDQLVMERAGCKNYSLSPWEPEKPNVYQRQLHFKFDKRIPGYVTSTQQKSRLSSNNGWLIEEVMTLHGVPLGDHYALHLRYRVEDLPSRSVGCNVQVYFGIAWLKYIRQQKKLTKIIISNLQQRLQVMFSVLEKEYVSGE